MLDDMDDMDKMDDMDVIGSMGRKKMFKAVPGAGKGKFYWVE